MKAIIFSFIISAAVFSTDVLSQINASALDCYNIPAPNAALISNFNGSIKPNRTDLSGNDDAPSDAYFPVLVVFVQFKNEASDPRNTWPMNSAPTYLNNLIARNKNSNGDWWNFYDPETEILSSHWIEISRGKFHVISPVSPKTNAAFSVVLPNEASYYQSLGIPAGELKINEDIWKSITSQGLTDWSAFDRWKFNTNDGHFYFTPLGKGDGYIDMIYKVHKSRGVGGLVNYAGYNALSFYNSYKEYLVDTVNNIKINYGNGFEGSGVTISYRGQLAQYITTMGHEHGHQLFSSDGHSTYSRVSFGFGFEGFYSPADMILNEYMSPSDVNFNSNNNLGDYSSRNSGNGNLLKVPVNGNEYFLLASRNKVSKWDRVMTGDLAQVDLYNEKSDYGKGLYIYHISNGINFPAGDISQQDMECADGLFEWEYAGQSAQQVVYDCFISGPDQWYYYKKKNVIYENDSSNLFRNNPPYGYTSRAVGDGISFRPCLYKNFNYESRYKWWSEGEKPANSCEIGTDRLFTNKEEVYTRFDIGGDREDPWAPGYNEIFSPYSSPNTNTWGNQYSGIFIWYRSFNPATNDADIEVYRAGEKGLSEENILMLTPPSRPMGLTVTSTDTQKIKNNYKVKILRWNHNQEPDMETISEVTGQIVKTYNVFRNKSINMNNVPEDGLKYPEKYYEKIATVEINTDSSPEYTDNALTTLNQKSDRANMNIYAVRYRIQAVDKYEMVSVLSDFVKTEAWTEFKFGEITSGFNGSKENLNIIPEEYALMQNFPNPFNPATTIQYDLPENNFVSIKVYDITGKEMTTVVNEFKEAGRHSIQISLDKLSSGMYFYRISAGEYVEVKKMALIK